MFWAKVQLDVLFPSTLNFCHSKILIYGLEKSFFLSLSAIFLPISSKVFPVMTIASSTTLFQSNAFCPFSDWFLYDSFQVSSTISSESLCFYWIVSIVSEIPSLTQYWKLHQKIFEREQSPQCFFKNLYFYYQSRKFFNWMKWDNDLKSLFIFFCYSSSYEE